MTANIRTLAPSEGVVSTAVISKVESVFAGGASAFFDGASSLVRLPDALHLRLYTDFTIEAAAFPVGNVAAGNDRDTVLMLHCDDTLADDPYRRTAAKVTLHGTAALSSTQKKFGTTSLHFDGTTGANAVVYDDGSLSFAGDFTIDFQVNPTSAGSNLLPIIFTKSGIQNSSIYSSPTQSPVRVRINATTTNAVFEFHSSSDGATWDIASAKSLGPVTWGTWTRLTVVRKGTTWRLFQNGVQQDTWTSSLTPMATRDPIRIGSRWQATDYAPDYSMVGYVDEFRISKVARYTAAFTPPVVPYAYADDGVVVGKGWSYQIKLAEDGVFRFSASSNGTSWDIADGVSMGAMVLNAWQTVAVSRVGSTWRTFNAGQLVSTFTSTAALYAGTDDVLIGTRGSDSYYSGYLDELRISQTGRYAASYTVAAVPFVWDEWTALLSHFDVKAAVQTDPSQEPIQRIEALAVLDRMLDAVANTFSGAVGKAAYPLRVTVGDVRANGESYLASRTLAAPLLQCFTAAREAGASFAQFQTVLAVLLVESPVSLTAVLLQQAGERFCLAQMARVLAATTFVSRDDADDALVGFTTACDPAIEEAYDEHDSGNYQALLTLHAAVTRDLAFRSLLLPQRIDFEFYETKPTLWIAQRVYQDGSRADEIRNENHIVHPLFPPRELRMLSL